MCYFYEQETGYFTDYIKKLLSKTRNADATKDTILITDQYEFALYKYFSRIQKYRNIVSIIVPLVAYGTISRLHVDSCLTIVKIINGDQKTLGTKYTLSSASAQDISYINDLKEKLDTNDFAPDHNDSSFLDKINDFTRDIYYIAASLEKEYSDGISIKWQFPKEFVIFKVNKKVPDDYRCCL